MSPLLAYIDPGLLTLVMQVIFVTILGGLFTWLTAPWRWFRGLFQRKQEPETDDAALLETDEGTPE